MSKAQATLIWVLVITANVLSVGALLYLAFRALTGTP